MKSFVSRSLKTLLTWILPMSLTLIATVINSAAQTMSGRPGAVRMSRPQQSTSRLSQSPPTPP